MRAEQPLSTTSSKESIMANITDITDLDNTEDEYTTARGTAGMVQPILRRGETVIIEGVKYRMTPGKEDGHALVPGDLYVGQRNWKPFVRIVRDISMGAVFPTEFAYAYDLPEVVGIEVVA
jgi:hypothetical protein